MEQFRPEIKFEAGQESPETKPLSPEVLSEQAAIDFLLEIEPEEMKDPMTFWSSFADLELVTNGKSEEYYIKGIYRGLSLDISLSVRYPTGMMGGGFRIARDYAVSVDGRRLNAENSKTITEHFRHILDAREKFLGLIHRM